MSHPAGMVLHRGNTCEGRGLRGAGPPRKDPAPGPRPETHPRGTPVDSHSVQEAEAAKKQGANAGNASGRSAGGRERHRAPRRQPQRQRPKPRMRLRLRMPRQQQRHHHRRQRRRGSPEARARTETGTPEAPPLRGMERQPPGIQETKPTQPGGLFRTAGGPRERWRGGARGCPRGNHRHGGNPAVPRGRFHRAATRTSHRRRGGAPRRRGPATARSGDRGWWRSRRRRLRKVVLPSKRPTAKPPAAIYTGFLGDGCC
mmetsp:Transcript_14947/g.30798  ORF Transcript_14947/g.30798 Transcript_14947/m.30798 type:complete len:258 (-) Transcript_14947:708-1481(-)